MDMVAGRVWADRAPADPPCRLVPALAHGSPRRRRFLPAVFGDGLEPFAVRASTPSCGEEAGDQRSLGLDHRVGDRDVRLSLLQGVRGVHLPRDARRARARQGPRDRCDGHHRDRAALVRGRRLPDHPVGGREALGDRDARSGPLRTAHRRSPPCRTSSRSCAVAAVPLVLRVPPAGHRHVDRAGGDRRRDARGRRDEAEAPLSC